MATEAHSLIGLDQAEASIVRRHLHRWDSADEKVARLLVGALQARGVLSTHSVIEPRWETNVYPLYYWAHREVGSSKEVYLRVRELISRHFPDARTSPTDEELFSQVRRLVNSEIDILVEDHDYFLSIEAKVAPPGGTAKFHTIHGVHQLVRQYVQGRILERLTSKRFELATIGANGQKPMKIDLNDAERDVLGLVEESRTSLEFVDLAWPIPKD